MSGFAPYRVCRLCGRVGTRGFVDMGGGHFECTRDTACRTRREATVRRTGSTWQAAIDRYADEDEKSTAEENPEDPA